MVDGKIHAHSVSDSDLKGWGLVFLDCWKDLAGVLEML